jgi:hypothetical protein
MVEIDPFNAVSHNVAVCKNLTTTLNEDSPFYTNMKWMVYDWLFTLGFGRSFHNM